MQAGLYQHFRGNFYQVLGVGRHEETLEEMVVYRATYGDHALWIRPRIVFEAQVEEGGKLVPRFKLIEPALDLETSAN